MYKIAVDLGYGYTKGINQDGVKIIFPSVVGAAHHRELKDLFGKSMSNNLDNIHIQLKEGDLEGEYFVGRLAFDSLSKSYAFDSNKIWHENTIVNLATVSALLGGGKGELLLVTGLPLQFYKNQQREFSSFLKMFDAEVTMKGENELPQTIRFARSAVFPQAAGAIYQAVAEHPQLKHPPGSTIAVVDVGFRTTDFIVVRIGTPLETVEALSGTIETGMSHLNRVFAEQYFAETGKQADFAQVTRYLANGCTFYFNGHKYDLSQKMESAKAELAKTIKDGLIANWRDAYQDFRAVIFVGGGSRELMNLFQKQFSAAMTVSNPQFANTQGFLFYANLLERKIMSGRGQTGWNK